MPQYDTWTPNAGSVNPTRTVTGGAGVTNWGGVNIENNSSLDLYVRELPNNVPTTTTFWRKVPPHGNVTVPLGTAGVTYLLSGTTLAGDTIQTVLTEEIPDATGNTGTVNVESGTLNITGPVNVETATGISIATSYRYVAVSNLGTPVAGTIVNLEGNVQQVIILNEVAAAALVIEGVQSGTLYYNERIGTNDSVAIRVGGYSPGTFGVDSQLRITCGATGGFLRIVQVEGPAQLSFNDIFPMSAQDPGLTLNKNLWVREAHAKRIVSANPTTAPAGILVVPAPGVGNLLQLHRIIASIDAAVAGNVATLSGGGLFMQFSGAVGGIYTMDCAGWCQTVQNVGITFAQNIAASWRLTFFLTTLPQ